MKDQDKSKQQLVSELGELRRRVASQEKDTEAALLLQVAPLGIHECDTDGRITFVNPSQERITGYTADELLGTRIWERIEPGPQKDSLPVYLKQLVSEQPPPTPFVARNIRKNGEVYDIRVDWNYKRNPQGQVTGFVCVVSDVTEQKRTGAALLESEERFRKVFEEGPLGVVLLSLEACIRRCNRRFCEMLGYSEEEIVALGLVGISHPEDWEKDFQFGSRLLRGEIPTYTIDKRYVRKGGTVFWGQLTVSMMHDAEGRSTMVIGMVEDISERKRAEAGLRDNERTLRTLMDASPESILLMDSKGTILFANTTTARRLGRPIEEIVGRTPYDVLPSEIAAVRMNYFEEVVRTGEPIRFADERFDRCLENAMHPILDEQGKVAAVAVLGVDQTEGKQAQEALKQAHDELEKRVEEQTAELAAANRQLKNEVDVRRNAEEALRQHRDMLQAIYDGMFEGLLILDFETKRLIRVNSSLCRMLGYTEEELLSMSVTDIHPAEEAPGCCRDSKHGSMRDMRRMWTFPFCGRMVVSFMPMSSATRLSSVAASVSPPSFVTSPSASRPGRLCSKAVMSFRPSTTRSWMASL